VKHSFFLRASFLRAGKLRRGASRNGNCRNLLMSSRVRREQLTERVEEQWNELLVHATIERDPEKMLRLTAELDQRKRRAEAVGKRNGNF
jgi:hypothetical protein